MPTSGRKPAVVFVQELISASPKKVRVIPRSDRSNEMDALLKVPGVSTLGTIVNQTGGVVVSDGIIRHLGGENALGTSLREINGIVDGAPTTMNSILLVAFDVFGGWFAIDMAASNPTEASVHYLPPEAYTWVDTGLGHTAFFDWSLSGETDRYYSDYSDVINAKSIPADDCVYSFNPPLWSNTGNDGKRRVAAEKAKNALAVRVGMIDSLKDIK